MKHYDELGGPKTYSHYAAGWAVAGDTPFTWTKQVASSYGGTRNGMVVHWPKGIKGKGEVRAQWHHVIDIAPTILEAAGLPEPKAVNGIAQTPIEGVSMLYSFNDARAKDRHLTQYFEIFGNRAIYHDGWLAGTVHKAPWEPKPRAALENDTWELYDTRSDFSLANDLAKKNPAKLKEMQELFMKEAEKYTVLPIDDRSTRARKPGPCRPARPDGRPHIAHGLRRDDRDVGERVHQHQEPLPHDHGRGHRSQGRRQGRDHSPRRAFRRLEPVSEERQADLHLQFPRLEEHHHCRQGYCPCRQGNDPLRVCL